MPRETRLSKNGEKVSPLAEIRQTLQIAYVLQAIRPITVSRTDLFSRASKPLNFPVSAPMPSRKSRPRTTGTALSTWQDVSHNVSGDRFSHRLTFLLSVSLPVFMLLLLSRNQYGASHQHRCSTALLDRWKDSLFERLMTSVKNTELRDGKAGDPAWPHRFSLFEPFASCSAGSVVKIGGDGDGTCPFVRLAPRSRYSHYLRSIAQGPN